MIVSIRQKIIGVILDSNLISWTPQCGTRMDDLFICVIIVASLSRGKSLAAAILGKALLHANVSNVMSFLLFTCQTCSVVSISHRKYDAAYCCGLCEIAS
ncbi:hypothetical protein AVEN_17184-1 [Araneus ventricosus]|uniref:Uncharacterized protein n=1 Tax=Araneus ventricosus TaxID=182803 RepID=A0A4Y2DUQ8_ARAVE|nr:hypothetical protein AVEN_17184-1 [Araneus ventricosus]